MQKQSVPSSRRWTITKIIQWGTSYFKTHAIDSPRLTAEILLAHALQCERLDLYLNYDQPLLAAELSAFKILIKRRINYEPVAYILGTKEFWSLDIEVTRDVLIPRPETECLVEAALEVLSQDFSPSSKRVLDLGTGSGAIVLALSHQHPGHVYFASDLSVKAAELARKNAKRHKLSKHVHLVVGDWFAPMNPVTSGFDMIVSNPPYIPSHRISELQAEIYRYEPVAALDGDTDGLACYKKIIGSAHLYLKSGGVMLLEIGHDQKDDVQRIVFECGQYEDIRFKKDYSGYDRVVSMRMRT